jgi:hypothetical protein
MRGCPNVLRVELVRQRMLPVCMVVFSSAVTTGPQGPCRICKTSM